MSLQDLNIKISYISYGDSNIVDSFINPCLNNSILYKRSVAYFSSKVFETISTGIANFIRNNGRIQLIISPELNEDDKNTIELGYMNRKSIIRDHVDKSFIEEINTLNDQNLEMLYILIAEEYLDIKIVTMNNFNSYHDKLGIFTDQENNNIVFFGSANSSKRGYSYNYEKIRVAKSWDTYDNLRVLDEIEEFDKLWNGQNKYVSVYEYKEAAKAHLIKVRRARQSLCNRQVKDEIILRDYQKEAIAAWKKNKYNGFFVMATGTGKTWTSIYALKEVLDKEEDIVVVVAPYKHLLKQWEHDIVKMFKDAKTILVSSENKNWENDIINEYIYTRYHGYRKLIIISTLVSFGMKKFHHAILKIPFDKILVVDEAHRFKNRNEIIKSEFKYKLGLSATPTNGKNNEEARKLLEFFGGKVFDLPIDEALKRKYLVPYNYYPIVVYATEYEEELFNSYSRKIAGCFNSKGICIDQDKLIKYSRARLRVLSTAENKMNNINQFIDRINELDHIVVYCGDGKIISENESNQNLKKYIEYVKGCLNNKGYKASQFTANEDMPTRMQRINSFNKGIITALVAIKCLDEGINIPSIKSALILSSNDDLREFIQRRGRILRLYEGKKEANIYDILVLPSGDNPTMAKIELRRAFEYAKLAKNYDDLYFELNNYLDEYGLNNDDVTINDEIEELKELDE